MIPEHIIEKALYPTAAAIYESSSLGARASEHAAVAALWVGLEAVYADIQAESAAEALHAALYELEATRSGHDVAECAAPVSGEVGRQDAIDAWITICEEPVEWMRRFAQRYAPESPSDEYVREQMAEAWDEGRDAVFDALRMLRAECDRPHSVDLGNLVREWLNGVDAGGSGSNPYRADEPDGGKS